MKAKLTVTSVRVVTTKFLFSMFDFLLVLGIMLLRGHWHV